MIQNSYIPGFVVFIKFVLLYCQSQERDLAGLIEKLTDEPEQGTALDNSFYKIRLSIASKGKGKSGGARIITNIVIADETVYLLSIYDKADKENLTDKELNELIEFVQDI